ncbi:MAG: pectate lyase, partial [Rikenellaceae bacterium]|nr:pectate lyase [Rikenellaceae bacterium]
GRLLAFPGAEGGGRYTTGGRGGKTLLVTKLTDDGSEGTLRWAISQKYPRTVLFAVAGTIELEKPLKIAYGDLTLAGQSAPGEGITLRNHGMEITASNVIVRYLRFRPGNTSGKECDAFGGKGARDVIIDHCSMSWSSDECSSFYAMRNFTMQWCIISESLARSIHAKGAHGYGGIWGGRNASFHHNLVAHHTSRNPRLDHPFVYSAEQMLTHRGTVEVTNNLIYNWGDKACYGGEWGWWNFVGNYYKAGPACDSDEGEFIEASVNKKTGHGTGRYSLTGNILTSSKASTRDNRLGMKNKGDHPAEELYSEHPFAMARGAIAIEKAERAYKRILQEAGASYRRDAIDSRIVEEVTHGTTHGVGSKSGIKGLIDSQEDVGGWLTIAPEKAPLDTDGDGMPDSWEKSHNLNPNDATDGALIAGQSGYTHLEIYLNGLLRQSK